MFYIYYILHIAFEIFLRTYSQFEAVGNVHMSMCQCKSEQENMNFSIQLIIL